MKLLLCFTLASMAFLVTNSRKIKIQIDSEDLVNIFEGMMFSEVIQKIASEIILRSSKKQGLRNPYHPEDDLLSTNSGVDKEKGQVKDMLRTEVPKLELNHDSLEKQNEQFLNGNDVEVDDILTEEDLKPTHELIETYNLKNRSSNFAINSTLDYIALLKNEFNNGTMTDEGVSKKTFDEEKVNFKPIQSRFVVVKGSTDKARLKTV